MLVLTMGAVLAVTLAIEAGFARAFPSLWRAGRWVFLPPLGGLVGALVPLGAVAALLPDQWLSLALGVGFGSLVAVAGAFHDALWRTAPDLRPIAVGQAHRQRS